MGRRFARTDCLLFDENYGSGNRRSNFLCGTVGTSRRESLEARPGSPGSAFVRSSLWPLEQGRSHYRGVFGLESDWGAGGAGSGAGIGSGSGHWSRSSIREVWRKRCANTRSHTAGFLLAAGLRPKRTRSDSETLSESVRLGKAKGQRKRTFLI